MFEGLRERWEDLTGVAEQRKLYEAAVQEVGYIRRELDLLGYTVLDYMSGSGQEVRVEERRTQAQKARVAWMSDPLVGGAVDLLNDFVFGRGVPIPRAKDEEVQEVLDEFWKDSDNQAALTSYNAQLALGVDLALQSNVFLLIFTGDDGRVKLSILNHDSVVDVVRDPENRLRPLWYVVEEKPQQEWDFKADQPKLDQQSMMPKKVYYAHWRNVAELERENADADRKAKKREIPAPPREKLREGLVYHIAVNRTTEQIFGVPRMQRILRWVSGYNQFVTARVDMAQAAAKLVMKRSVTGTPGQVARLAQQALTRRGELGGVYTEAASVPPANAAILLENEAIKTEPFNLRSGGSEALADAQLLRSQMSVATRWPAHYLGDSSNANLATATSLELPVRKGIESHQEMFEQLIRALTDLVIERAIDAGRLDATVPRPEQLRLREAGPDALDEEETGRDLSYEFSMPNPIQRVMADLVGAAATVARTFDPNASNLELSKVLMGIILGEGFEVQDAAGLVEKIFPPGYVDPAIAAAQAQAGMGPDGLPLAGAPQFTGDYPDEGAEAGGPGMGPQGEENPYGTKQKGTEWSQQAAMQESVAPLPRARQLRKRGEHPGDSAIEELAAALQERGEAALAAIAASMNGQGTP